MNNYITIRREEGRRGLNRPFIFCLIERVVHQWPLAFLWFMLLVISVIMLNMYSLFLFCSSILYSLHIICLFIDRVLNCILIHPHNKHNTLCALISFFDYGKWFFFSVEYSKCWYKSYSRHSNEWIFRKRWKACSYYLCVLLKECCKCMQYHCAGGL